MPIRDPQYYSPVVPCIPRAALPNTIATHAHRRHLRSPPVRMLALSSPLSGLLALQDENRVSTVFPGGTCGRRIPLGDRTDTRQTKPSRTFGGSGDARVEAIAESVGESHDAES